MQTLMAILMTAMCMFQDPITPAEFQSLHQSIKPSTDPWKSIPWKTSLIEAQNLAASQQKPMFIWTMDGHPLGCT